MKVFLVILVVALVVVAAAGGALYYFTMMRPAAVGPMPGEALALPADTGFLTGVDVKGLFASTTYKQLASGDFPMGDAIPKEQADTAKKELKEGIAKGLKEAEAKTGVRFDQDVDQIVLGVAGVTEKEPQVAGLAFGRFDRAKIKAAIEAAQKADGGTTTSKTAGKASLLVFEKNGKSDAAVAFLDDHALAFGTPALVEATALNFGNRTKALDGNTSVIALVKALKPDTGYWFVAGQSVLDKIKQEAGSSAPANLFPQTVTLAGGFDGGMELSGQMADEAAAKNAADMLRGGLAMAKMQAAQAQGKEGAAAAKLIEGVTIDVQGKTLRITSATPAGGSGGLGMVAAIAIPSLLRARTSANEAAAIGDIRTVISAEVAYQSTSGGAYAELRCLAEPKSCVANYNGPVFIDAGLGSLADKGGYKRQFFPGQQMQGGFDSFAYTAAPVTPGRTGVRSFCGDSSGVVCSDPGGAAIDATGGHCPSTCAPLQ